MKNILLSVFSLFLAFSVSAAFAGTVTITFENDQLGADQQLTSANSYWNGSQQNTPLTATPNGNYKNANDANPFSVNGVKFSNAVSYDSQYFWWSWDGFGISNAAGTFEQGGQTTEMFAYPSTGAHNGSNYLVGYTSDWHPTACIITFPGTVAPQSVYVANTAWTALGAIVGDSFCNGLIDGDSVKLKIYGGNNGEYSETCVSFDLAYKNAGENMFVLQDWESVDLTSLGLVDSLKVTLDVTGEEYGGAIGEYGANIATYFALDDLVYETATPVSPSVPEPAAWALLALGFLGLGSVRKRNKK